MRTFTLELSNQNVTLTAYIPDASNEYPHMNKRRAMLVLPGGAYKFCSDREAEPIAFEYLAKGYVSFILRYSLNENAEFPRPLDDAQEALKLIRSHADEWNVDPEKVAAIGFSAGGHLCAALAAMAEEKPNAALLGYPCILEDISGILPFEIPNITNFVDKNTTPCFIFSSREDGCVPINHSLRMADALEKAGINFEIHIFSTGYHGFSTAKRGVYSEQKDFEYNKHLKVWVDLSEVWLNKLYNEEN